MWIDLYILHCGIPMAPNIMLSGQHFFPNVLSLPFSFEAARPSSSFCCSHALVWLCEFEPAVSAQKLSQINNDASQFTFSPNRNLTFHIYFLCCTDNYVDFCWKCMLIITAPVWGCSEHMPVRSKPVCLAPGNAAWSSSLVDSGIKEEEFGFIKSLSRL